MPNYRRNFVEGGTYFFTVVTYNRQKILCTDFSRQCLRESIKACQQHFPFEDVAWVLLDDHLHTIWILPNGDSNFSGRWSFIKREFTKAYAEQNSNAENINQSRQSRNEKGIWQRRFWEHTIRSEYDFGRCMDYIHYNPVKHDLVEAPQNYEFSTFHRFVKEGIYPQDWGSSQPLDFTDLANKVGE